MSLEALLSNWKRDPETAPNLAVWKTFPARPAHTVDLPADLPAPLAEALQQQGIHALFTHQAAAWEHIRSGGNIVLATGTASGKTLAYHLPVLAGLAADEQARALYLFPTKALAQDQLSILKPFQISIAELTSGIYDGDTPQSVRSAIRERARIIFSNPDMLHTGILPHHTSWGEFLRGLRFIVVDEMHSYRGVFGSHVANVFRRLKRITRFYGSKPQFILTSATIGNPAELAEWLTEEPVTLVAEDGSSRGPRHFLIYNPPVVDADLGLRKSALMEAVRLGQDLLACDVQSVIFARSRRSVEMIIKYLQSEPAEQASHKPVAKGKAKNIRGYRSGYLSGQRREIERGLRDGSVRLVVATNALELGVDIGGLGVALLVGYPGTIASTWQQAGRAGRGETAAAAVLVVTAGPLDQFLAHHPDYFFGRSPEQALINPNHVLILLSHLRCAAFELPFQRDEEFGRLPAEALSEYLEFLAQNGDLHLSKDKFFWMADAYPAGMVSLRSASAENVVLQLEVDGFPRTLGEVDLASACWMVHPSAIYLHEGQPYYVQRLDLEKHVAHLQPVDLDYYTEPMRRTQIHVLNRIGQEQVHGGEKAFGELQVSTQVVGFRKWRWFTHENLGDEPLDLPASEFQTTGYWVALSSQTVERLRDSGLWKSNLNAYGSGWTDVRLRVRARDEYRCAVCGAPEDGREHDVHHKVPFRLFSSPAAANQLDNLITLCPVCHRRVELNVRMRSGLAGLSYVLSHLAPLFLMCDIRDLGVQSDPQAPFAEGLPAVVVFDQVPAGIGFSQKLFEIHDQLVRRALELVSDCPCKDGCPSCVGPAGERGIGGKVETMAILKELVASQA